MDKRERGATLGRALKAIQLLVGKPRRPADLMVELDCSRRTVERVLAGIEQSGFTFKTERQGREVFYSLPRDALKKAAAS